MRRVAKFVWIENDSVVETGDWGALGISGWHKLVGFKPAPGNRIGGWLVFMTAPLENESPRDRRLHPAPRRARKLPTTPSGLR
jgi:hypothetical protein